MTTEELRRRILKTLCDDCHVHNVLGCEQSKSDMDDCYGYLADEIMALFRQSGWKSPEQINQWLEEHGAVKPCTKYWETYGTYEPLRLEIKK